MTKQVIGIHLVCRNSLNVTDSRDGYFYSGYWKIAEHHAKTAQYLALHESKAQQSYKQGVIKDWELSEQRPGRIIFHVKTTDTPYEWVGGGTGEKGYYWSVVHQIVVGKVARSCQLQGWSASPAR